MNKPILEFTKHGTRVAFTRSRPYKKNDNCFVEQKKFTHVRELFGYERFEDEDLRKQKAKLNPFTLKRGLEEKLKEFFEHVRKTKIGIADGDEENQKRAA